MTQISVVPPVASEELAQPTGHWQDFSKDMIIDKWVAGKLYRAATGLTATLGLVSAYAAMPDKSYSSLSENDVVSLLSGAMELADFIRQKFEDANY